MVAVQRKSSLSNRIAGYAGLAELRASPYLGLGMPAKYKAAQNNFTVQVNAKLHRCR